CNLQARASISGHEMAFRPSVEFIPTKEEINSYELMFEEDLPKFIPRGYEFLREVPVYMNLKECFERCLDFYLCPRTRKKRLNIDPEDLKPKFPNKKNLQPYPTTCFLEYKGHTGPVTSISIESSGQLIASGSIDGTVRIWEIETGRCLRDWKFDEPILHVAWNPISELPILAVAGQDVVLLNASLGNAEDEEKVKDLLVSAPVEIDESSELLMLYLLILPTHACWSLLLPICSNYSKDINHVAFHRSYPLFASCSNDCSAYVFHGMVYSDLNENPCIVALEILEGHESANGRGVLDCKFHPRQPWLFTAGADSIIKLFCH
ncbi:ribosome biogenesis protein BOP1 homolog, partial [Nymphaea colorata]